MSESPKNQETRTGEKRKRHFLDAATSDRCQYSITLRDKSQAQCGRRAISGRWCRQHTAIVARESQS